MIRLLSAILLVVGMVSSAYASKVSDRAHDVVRLRVASDGYSKVDFNSTRESRLPKGEVQVSGSGTAFNRRTDRIRRLTYSVVVKTSSLQTRNLVVRYVGDGGAVVPPIGGGSADLRIDTPRSGQVVRSTQVDFRGRATGRWDVEVKIYDERGDKVAEKSTSPRGDRFDLNVYVRREGRFRAVVTHGGRTSQVWFRVNKDNGWEGGWGNDDGWDNHNIQIVRPADGAYITGSRIRFEGTALRTSRVRVRVYRGAGGGTLFNETRSVRNGRWECEVSLSRGTYRVRVSTSDNDDGKMISFTVR